MIALIPARGGSKGLPGKNVKMLCGKPLIAYAIEAAMKVKKIDNVIVTTDSEEIAQVAKEYGAEVPFIRPKELARDSSSAIDVYLHAISFLQKETNRKIEKFMVLLPTTPLRTCRNIEEALTKFQEEEAETLISVKEADIPISWYYRMNQNNRIENAGFDKLNAVSNRQVNKKYYIPNGAIYILDVQLLHEKRTYFSSNTVAYIMSAEESIDIDNELDFEIARMLLEKRELLGKGL